MPNTVLPPDKPVSESEWGDSSLEQPPIPSCHLNFGKNSI